MGPLKLGLAFKSRVMSSWVKLKRLKACTASAQVSAVAVGLFPECQFPACDSSPRLFSKPTPARPTRWLLDLLSCSISIRAFYLLLQIFFHLFLFWTLSHPRAC